MTVPDEWTYEPMPPIDGWFAVIRCWEIEEGMFPDAVWATAGKVAWPENGGIADDGQTGHAGPFPTKEMATAWAYAHDPEG